MRRFKTLWIVLLIILACLFALNPSLISKAIDWIWMIGCFVVIVVVIVFMNFKK